MAVLTKATRRKIPEDGIHYRDHTEMPLLASANQLNTNHYLKRIFMIHPNTILPSVPRFPKATAYKLNTVHNLTYPIFTIHPTIQA
jgi:hypothetical protein